MPATGGKTISRAAAEMIRQAMANAEDAIDATANIPTD